MIKSTTGIRKKINPTCTIYLFPGSEDECCLSLDIFIWVFKRTTEYYRAFRPHSRVSVPKATGVSSFIFFLVIIAFVTVEHVFPPKNAMSLMGFDPGTSRMVSHCSTN